MILPKERRDPKSLESQIQPMPRAKRQRQRPKSDRGLPPDKELTSLAKDFIREQSKLWPQIVAAGLLPDINDDANLATMVEEFKERHRKGEVDPGPLKSFLKYCSHLGGNYSRFSCDISSPTSINDQMVNALKKAKDENRFVPWAYVFADYSISGMNPARQGYSSYKQLLQHPGQLIESTYIDDFTRLSRDEIEWWRLAHMSKRLHKRMIGASDGFDLSNPNWDIQITIFGLLSRLFLKGLREKVLRGMRGSARRRTNIGKPSLGFTRIAQLNENGQTIQGKDGKPVYVRCIDPATVEARRLLYDLFVTKRWTGYKICKHFNALKIDGSDTWSINGIGLLLYSATAVGVDIWNKTRREYNREEEKWSVVKNPRSEWEVSYDPKLAIIPIAMFAATRKRLSELRRASPRTGQKMSRNEKSASTLFSGTLVCESCGRELLLQRSAANYKMMGCLSGIHGRHGCTLTSLKSTRIIESSLLGFLRGTLLTEGSVTALVERANELLVAEANRPRTNLEPIKASIREKEAAIKKLFQRLEECNDEALIQAYERRIAEQQKLLNDDKSRLRELEPESTPPPPPLTLESVKQLLQDLRGLLDQETPAAAEAIRDLTGTIKIRQEKVPGQKRGAKWIATFQPDFLGWLAKYGKEKRYPESITLETLKARNWIISEQVEVTLVRVLIGQ